MRHTLHEPHEDVDGMLAYINMISEKQSDLAPYSERLSLEVKT